MADRPKVVILGAGFGGMTCAEHLAGAAVDVTVVDRNNFSTFQPLLYQVATAGLNSADVAYPIRSALRRHRGVDFRWAEVIGVDWEVRELTIADQGVAGVETTTLPFDHLVVAAGGAVNYFGIPGGAEHALPLYSLTEAVAVRNQVLREFEAAAAVGPEARDGALTVVVVGGGPTGVEVAGAMSELFGKVFPSDFHRLDVGSARVVLVEATGELLGAFGDKSRAIARDTLTKRGVEVRLGEQVAEIDEKGVTFASGERIDARTIVWAAGVKGAPVSHELGIDTGKGGRIVVDPFLRVPEHPGVWALGDIAQIDARAAGAEGDYLPGLAQVAMQGGRYVAGAIRGDVAGTPLETPFHYKDKGIMATIGRRSAVVELPNGIRLSGTPAWLAWLALHLLFLTGVRNRVSVLLNWAWNYVWWNPASRLIFEAREPK